MQCNRNVQLKSVLKYGGKKLKSTKQRKKIDNIENSQWTGDKWMKKNETVKTECDTWKLCTRNGVVGYMQQMIPFALYWLEAVCKWPDSDWYCFFFFSPLRAIFISISLYHIFTLPLSFGYLLFCLFCIGVFVCLLSCFHYKKMNYDVGRHNSLGVFYFIFSLCSAFLVRIDSVCVCVWDLSLKKHYKRVQRSEKVPVFLRA